MEIKTPSAPATQPVNPSASAPVVPVTPKVATPVTPTAPVAEPQVSTTTKVELPPPPPCDIVVTRNDVNMPFKFFRILKGKRANTLYPSVEVTPETLVDIEKWIGTPNLVNQIQNFLKKIFQSIALQSVNTDTGVFDEALFVKYAVDFTTTGMKLSDINDKLDELTAELSKMIDTGAWMKDDAARAALTDLNNQVRAYRQMKEDKQRKPAEPDEDVQPSVVAT